MLPYRVARFFLVQHTKMGENIPKNHNKYEIASKFTKMAIKYTNIFHSKNLPNWDFLLKICHLATLNP
jgi:hypothetical protein